MKKNYSKPEIVFESFTLSTNIAAGCEIKHPLPTSGQCGIEFDGDVIFVEGACPDPVVDGTGGFCYHNPSDLDRMFNS